jgi:hypothetical protein
MFWRFYLFGGRGRAAPPEMQRMLQAMSKNNLTHSIRHLSEFQKLDPKMTAEGLREIGARIATNSSNLISRPNAAQKVYEQTVNICGKEVPVRAALNRTGNLHSIHIKN